MTKSGTPVAVVGGGPVGMALALALHQQGIGATVLEARAREAIKHDVRVLALSFGSQQILERLGVWESLGLTNAATPIQTIHVSRRGNLGRARMRADELGVPALGYVLPAANLITALDAALRQAEIPYHDHHKISCVEDVAAMAPVSTLTVWAEGSVSDGAGQFRDYNQAAILCTAMTKVAHDHVAWERFTADGPVALLPLGNDYAVVLTCAAAEAASIVAQDDATFTKLLQTRFGQRHQFVSVGPRASYPLTLRWREEVIAERQVWLGNAAQTLHPVAGQGFNLALRDVWELTRHLSALSREKDLGAQSVLRAYAQSRKLDRRSVIGFTNGLIDVFGSDIAPLAHARGAGLVALDLLPPLRNFLARRMMFGSRGR
ncbi:MAG: FAD-dependent monooxygenase [Rhodocyclaceae bacterium]|nr:FAD-dependent monooxygenase [Rhodocyclaceae bacterium]